MRCSISSLFFHLCTFHLLHFTDTTITAHSFKTWADELGRQLLNTFTEATKSKQIIENYGAVTKAETFDPRTELKKVKVTIERYLDERAKMAWDAKVSLQGKALTNYSDDQVNNPAYAEFIRYMNAKSESDATTVHSDSRTSAMTYVNSTRNFQFEPNANFYGIETSREASAVHIPTPVYDRKLDVLQKIEWSDIDQHYRSNQERVKDLSFQMFCSESGFMRYFPAAPWVWESKGEELDLFDCRSTEWYISGATMSKNMIIMLDLSGSMLGQRFEIAKQTIEAILDTLSDNDYFNILPFSKTASFLDECTEQNTLIQATIRNKKYLRAKLNEVASEGKAEYEKGLSKAFQTLMNLPGEVIFKRKEELLDGSEESRNLKNNQSLHFVYSDEHVLVLDRNYLEAIGNFTGKERQLGCNNVIMLITDGAPGYYKEIFNLYNKDKKVRFFSFLIGEEAIDFDEVTWMACNNRGFMVHVSNMADVQEKVQHYIKVMSRPLGRYASRIEKDQPLWSGVYKERLYLPRIETDISAEEKKAAELNSTLSGGGPPARKKTKVTQLDAKSELFVTTVSYPVVLNGEFMGVSAVSIPIRELIQLTQVRNIGSQSYFFMVDKNGHVMFHPQLQPIDRNTKQVKPNYNNMDFLELEVPQNQQKAREAIINCDNTETFSMDILFANHDMSRVYRQTNDYYSECIQRAHFSIGMAVAKNDEVRLNRKSSRMDYDKIDRDWFSGKRWRIHPKWRYCLLNDTDTGLSAEEAFQNYVKLMRESGRLPELCKSRKELVDRVIMHGEATNNLENYWDLNWEQHKEKGIHLVFFATTTGFIKFHNQTLVDYLYEDPNYVEHSLEDDLSDRFRARKPPVTPVINKYEHYILELNRKSMADSYFKRAVRMQNTIIFDVNARTKLWYGKPIANAYGNEENETLLLTATQALYQDHALLGVVGMEFVYDHLVNIMAGIGCGPAGYELWCFLIDEHAYTVYSSLNTTTYSAFFSQNERVKRENVIGKWFGHINRVTQRTMDLLVAKNFYTVTTFVDYQAMCKDDTVVPVAASASRIAFSLLRTVAWFLHRLVTLVTRTLPSLLWLEYFSIPAKAYTVSFQSNSDEYPCDKMSNFYTANPTSRQEAMLIPENVADHPCPLNTKCTAKLYASWVPHTNLLLVGIHSSSSWCYDETQCAMHVGADVKTKPENVFEFIKVEQSLSIEPTGPGEDAVSPKCRHLVPPKLSSAANHCFNDEPIFDESAFPCSSTDSLSSFTFLLLCVVVGQLLCL